MKNSSSTYPNDARSIGAAVNGFPMLPPVIGPVTVGAVPPASCVAIEDSTDASAAPRAAPEASLALQPVPGRPARATTAHARRGAAIDRRPAVAASCVLVII